VLWPAQRRLDALHDRDVLAVDLAEQAVVIFRAGSVPFGTSEVALHHLGFELAAAPRVDRVAKDSQIAARQRAELVHVEQLLQP
jgi:hypothetical protein